MDDNTFRILISTDNHLGYMERDAVRCNGDLSFRIIQFPISYSVSLHSYSSSFHFLDSFAAFEEVMITAKNKNADFVLLAGDLFHDNKPSRRTMHATMDLLRSHVYGDEPVFFKITNEQMEVFKNRRATANFEDPHQAISLPVFSIHGSLSHYPSSLFIKIDRS